MYPMSWNNEEHGAVSVDANMVLVVEEVPRSEVVVVVVAGGVLVASSVVANGAVESD